jgi:hypothetical protein
MLRKIMKKIDKKEKKENTNTTAETCNRDDCKFELFFFLV